MKTWHKGGSDGSWQFIFNLFLIHYINTITSQSSLSFIIFIYGAKESKTAPRKEVYHFPSLPTSFLFKSCCCQVWVENHFIAIWQCTWLLAKKDYLSNFEICLDFRAVCVWCSPSASEKHREVCHSPCHALQYDIIPCHEYQQNRRPTGEP